MFYFSGKIKVYPNPADNYLNIDATGTGEVYSYTLLSAEGRRIAEERNLTGGLQTLQLANLANGIYLLQLQTTGGSYTAKVAVQR